MGGKRLRRKSCWGCCSMAMPPGCSVRARSRKPPTRAFPFASSPAACIPTMTRSPTFARRFWPRSKSCSCKSCCWRRRRGAEVGQHQSGWQQDPCGCLQEPCGQLQTPDRIGSPTAPGSPASCSRWANKPIKAKCNCRKDWSSQDEIAIRQERLTNLAQGQSGAGRARPGAL